MAGTGKNGNTDLKDMENKFQQFTSSSNYYGTLMHPKTCKICKLPRKYLNNINEMLLKGTPQAHVGQMLLEEYPDDFSQDNISRSVRQHAKYLPYLLEETTYKSMFKRAKRHLKDKNLDTMPVEEKLKIISQIEEEIIKEYSNMEFERISLMNVFYKETLPLMLTRLHNEIVAGEPKGIRDITLASEAVVKMSQIINNAPSIANEEKPLDYNEYDENKNPNEQENKEKIVSLTDKINKATEGKTG